MTKRKIPSIAELVNSSSKRQSIVAAINCKASVPEEPEQAIVSCVPQQYNNKRKVANMANDSVDMAVQPKKMNPSNATTPRKVSVNRCVKSENI